MKNPIFACALCLAMTACIDGPAYAESLVALEKRFYLYGGGPGTGSRERVYAGQADALEDSNPVKDAQSDNANGKTGFMTLTQIPRGGGRHHAPGILCSESAGENSQSVSRHAVMTFTFGDALRENEWRALRLFEKYATAYNQYVFVNYLHHLDCAFGSKLR